MIKAFEDCNQWQEIYAVIKAWHEGDKQKVVVLIDEYGKTFFEDLEFWLSAKVFYMSERESIFHGIAKMYISVEWERKCR